MDQDIIRIENKLDTALRNQEIIMSWLYSINLDINKSRFVEDYAANLAAQYTEILFGHNIIRK